MTTGVAKKGEFNGTIIVILSVVLFFAVCVIVYLLAAQGGFGKMPGFNAYYDPENSLQTYMSFIGVMLTVVTVVLTAVTIGIAMLSIYSFKEIKKSAEESAAKAIAEKLDPLMKELEIPALNSKIEDAISKIMYGNMGVASPDLPSDEDD